MISPFAGSVNLGACAPTTMLRIQGVVPLSLENNRGHLLSMHGGLRQQFEQRTALRRNGNSVQGGAMDRGDSACTTMLMFKRSQLIARSIV